MAKRKGLKPFDRYALYRRAVQAPDVDVEFLVDTYKELRGKKPPRSLREDFCGTFAICCEWVKKNKQHRAIGVDLDFEPLKYGRDQYFLKLKPDQQKRLDIYNDSVLTVRAPKVDLIAALNFSYFIFKQPKDLQRYFRKARQGLKKNGLFVIDCFGGTDCFEPNVERSKISGDFYYYWDQASFDPITNEAMFYIHFKRQGEKRRDKVFSYDWRLWSIPELREHLYAVGFKKVHVYWEGTTRYGNGDGIFKRREKGEDCDGWVAYVVAEA